MGYKANRQPQQAQQAGASDFDSLKDSGLIALSGDDVEVIKNQIAEDGNNKITSFIWFYAPWCGFCTRIISTMDEVGRAMKQYSDKVKIYMINGDNKPAIMSTFNVRGFPTLNAYHGQHGVPTPYSGDRSANDIITFLKTEMNK
jgi:thiol-disulfide isomerase/thioredoxin